MFMKARKYVLGALMIPMALFGIREGLNAQSLDLSKSVTNITTGSPGTNAAQGHVLEYTIVVRNIATVSLTNATLSDNIPAGSSYVAGSTTLNSAAVPDISGTMRYTSAGSLINTPLQAAGVLAPGATATIKFRVKVTANGGNITNFAIVQCKNGSTDIVQSTNTVFTNLTPDATCSRIFMSNAKTPDGTPQSSTKRYYRYLREMNTSNGTAGPILYDGEFGLCKEIVGGVVKPLGVGTVMKYVSAIAYDKDSNRIYFVNNYDNPRQVLCYVDLDEPAPRTAYQFTGYPLPSQAGSGWNINRMGYASDGFGYAITESGSEIIRFTIAPGNVPVITPLGPLINDATNGSDNDILSEVGGDVFGDGSGNLYLIANSSKLYKINPNTRITTFLGSVNPFPTATSNSIAVDASGTVYIGGGYQNVYTVNLTTMGGTSITGGSTTNVYTSGDYASCGFPVLAPALTANKSYRNINGRPVVVGGDTVEYRIDVTNTGNINAAGVKLFDDIPSTTNYIPGSTKLNGIPVPDVGGAMPFSVSGGRFINSLVEQSGIIKPGAAYKAVVTFNVKIAPLSYVCNQSKITLLDVNGNVIFINSNDPTLPGGQNPTCFFSDGSLPIKNLSFSGSLLGDRSQLKWTVKDEQLVDYYEVQYSPDGSNFMTIGEVYSKGNTTGANEYKFTDAVNTQSTNRFYRLRIVGTRGGDHSYSSIIRLSLKNLQTIRVQPNPFDEQITVNLQLRNAEQVQIKLVDFSGKEILRSDERLARGEHTINIPVAARLSPGVYILELYTGSDNSVSRHKLVRR